MSCWSKLKCESEGSMPGSLEVGFPICCEIAELSYRALMYLIYYYMKTLGGAHDPHGLESSQEKLQLRNVTNVSTQN